MDKIKVKSVMTSPIETIASTKSVKVAAELMSKKNISGLLVIEEDNQRGIITERDIVHAIAQGKVDQSISEFTAKPLITIDEDAYLGEAAQLMLAKGIRRLIVTDDNGTISGIITMRDLTLAVHEGFLTLFDA